MKTYLSPPLLPSPPPSPPQGTGECAVSPSADCRVVNENCGCCCCCSLLLLLRLPPSDCLSSSRPTLGKETADIETWVNTPKKHTTFIKLRTGPCQNGSMTMEYLLQASVPAGGEEVSQPGPLALCASSFSVDSQSVHLSDEQEARVHKIWTRS